MPLCRNDKSRHYKGTEPSPKGLGWCSHACKLNTRKRGKNGQMWQVKKCGKSKRWVKAPVLKKTKKTRRTKKTTKQKKPKRKTLRGGSNQLVNQVIPQLLKGDLEKGIREIYNSYKNRNLTDEKIMTSINKTITNLSNIAESKKVASPIHKLLTLYQTMKYQLQPTPSTWIKLSAERSPSTSSQTQVIIMTLYGKKTAIPVQKTDLVYVSIQPMTDERDFAGGSKLYYGKECVWQNQMSDENKTWLDIEKDIGQQLEAVPYFMWI